MTQQGGTGPRGRGKAILPGQLSIGSFLRESDDGQMHSSGGGGGAGDDSDDSVQVNGA